MGSTGTAANIAPAGNPPAAPGGTLSTSGSGTLNPSASINLNPFKPRIAPIKEISISAAMINSLNNDPKFSLLDMSLDNYSVWERCMKSVLELNNLFKYALGQILEPTFDMTLNAENASYWAYVGNNAKIVAFINVNISEIEQPFIEGEELAHMAWTALKNRHQGRGPIIQISLMQEASRLSFGPDVADLPGHVHRAKDLISRIYAPGFPTQETFLMVTLFSGLEAHHPGIGSDARTHYTNNPAAGASWLLDRISQEVVWKSKTALPEVAMVAGGSGRPVCTVPSCKRTGHTKATCWQPGGDMFGKEAEQREIIAKKREARGGDRGGRGGKSSGRGGKPDNNPFRKATNGRAYLIDADTNEAVFISNSNTSDGTISITSPAVANSNTALMALHTSQIPDAWALSAQSSAPSASTITSTWSFTDDDDSFDRALAAVASTGGDKGRYWLDSGSTTNLTNDRSDFADFRMIKPRSIRGIGGAVSAIGIGSVRLATTLGYGDIILENVLYVPDAGVRLISVRALALAARPLETLFTAAGCRLIDSDGRIIAIGHLSTAQAGLYSLDSAETAEQVHIATRAPQVVEKSLQSWLLPGKVMPSVWALTIAWRGTICTYTVTISHAELILDPRMRLLRPAAQAFQLPNAAWNRS